MHHGQDMTATTSSSTRPVGLVDLGSILFLGSVWGGAFLFLHIAAPEVGAVWAAEIRVVIGAAILLAVAGRRTWAAARGRLVAFAVMGAAMSAIPFSLIAFSTLTLPAGLGALLNAATPLFTAMLGVAFLGQRLTVRALAGLGAGMAAVLVLVGWSPLDPGPRTIVAVLAALGAAFAYAVGGTYARRRLADVGGLEMATGQLAAAALLLLPVALLSGQPGEPSAAGLASLIAVGTVSTALAWPVFFRVLSHTTPTAASTVTFVVPAFGIAWGALALGETVGVEMLVGGALILASLVLVLGLRPSLPSLARSRRRPDPAHPAVALS
jgi:drug/metabolite transporter (DMT)-like permease